MRGTVVDYVNLRLKVLNERHQQWLDACARGVDDETCVNLFMAEDEARVPFTKMAIPLRWDNENGRFAYRFPGTVAEYLSIEPDELIVQEWRGEPD